jgi:hypothetical protein
LGTGFAAGVSDRGASARSKAATSTGGC